MSPLAELFSDGDYRFHLTLRRGEPREFFRQQDETGRVLTERARWLQADAARYAALLPEGAASLREFATIAAQWGAAPFTDAFGLGFSLEPDVLLLAPDAGGEFRLCGGALCFPTGWALEEKLGQAMDFIHGPVPGLNAALGASIRQFLARLKPGTAFLRDNWGLAATDELNLHPARRLPPPRMPVRLDQLWLRVEHQALLALPESGAIAFGIRIALHRLDQIVTDRVVAGGLRRALESMPAPVAAYKRIDAVGGELVSILRQIG